MVRVTDARNSKSLSEQRIMEREERIRQEEIEKQSRERVERRKAVQDLIESNGVSTVSGIDCIVVNHQLFSLSIINVSMKRQ